MVEIPATYYESKTETDEPIKFPSSWDAQQILIASPLFADIEVELNGVPMPVGKNFPINDYTLLSVVNFPKWGKVRVLVAATDSPPWENVSVLSNGIIQFKDKVLVDPDKPYGDSVPFKFFLNIEPSVKATSPFYPFALNRQGISLYAKNDYEALVKYLNVLYANTATEKPRSRTGY